MDKTAIVLFAMQSLKADGSWCGETHVQKMLYLCQEMMEVPSKFKFILYKHGPYSFELSEHLQALIADNLVSVNAKPPYGPSLRITPEAGKIAQEAQGDVDICKRVKFLSKRLSNKGVAELEKLATAVFVDKKLGSSTSLDKRAEYLVSIKPHVSIDAAKSAFSEAAALKQEAQKAAIM